MSEHSDADALLVLTTAPDERVAELLANTLVQERLVACVNILGGVRSVYQWQGKVDSASEVLLLMKTTRLALDALKQRLPALHPYEVPELIALRIDDGLPSYLAWIAAETKP